jgi:subtilisin family serine protease
MRKLILFTSIFLFSTLLFGQSEAFEQGRISPFTEFFISQLKEAESDSVQESIQQRFGLRTQAKRQYISAFIELSENINPDFLSEYGVKINTHLSELNMLTAKIPVEKIEIIALHPSVKHLEIGTPVESQMSTARPLANVQLMHDGINLDMPYTGRGVVIGIVDVGFDLNHINFFSSDQSRYRVVRFWDQNDNTGTPPSGFTYGSEFRTETEIRAAGHDVYTATSTVEGHRTHGTHVAGIAAGADLYNHNVHGQNFGVAPDAYLVFVSTTLRNTGTIDGVRYIFRYAESVNKPAVVNLSLGGRIGPRDGTSAFDRVADDLVGEGRLLVASAGNDGGRNLHASKTFQSNDTLRTFLALQPANRSNANGTIEIWGDPNMNYSVQLFSYNTRNGVKIPLTEVHAAATSQRTTVQVNTNTHGVNGNVSVVTQRNAQNRRANAQMHLNLNSISFAHSIVLEITANSGTVNAWIASDDFLFSSGGRVGWTDGGTQSTVTEIGTGKRTITVGAFVSDNLGNPHVRLHDIASFSSRGPTADGRMKPDITAPGSMIIASYSNAISAFSPSIAYSHIIDGQRFLYGRMQGTSMSAPFVAGVLATWLQARNNLTPEEVRTIIQQTAINDEHTGDIRHVGNNTWGFGKIDAWSGIQKTLDLNRREKEEKEQREKEEKEQQVEKERKKMLREQHGDIAVSSNMQYRTLHLEQLNDDAENIQMRIFNISGQLIIQQRVFAEGDKSIIDLSQIGSGVFIVSFTGENLRARPERIILP